MKFTSKNQNYDQSRLLHSDYSYIKITIEITFVLEQGWATFFESGPDPLSLFFKGTKGNKTSEYDSCNEMKIIIAKISILV